MRNLYKLKPARIIKVEKENDLINTLYFKLYEQNKFSFFAGQFMQIGLPGFGECPISISSNPKESKKYFSLSIRSAGELTIKLNKLKREDIAFVRGPFGNGFPEVNKNLILIGGGCGFVPLKSVYEENKDRKDIRLQIFIGCKTKGNIVYKSELGAIASNHSFNIAFEDRADSELKAEKGLITELIQNKALLENAFVFVCGPEAMFGHIVKLLLRKEVKPADIYLSLEKRMHCGIGICQHCAIGTKYICKDGPVFCYDFLKTLPAYRY